MTNLRLPLSRAKGKTPFLIDLDYHAGDGSAAMLVEAKEAVGTEAAGLEAAAMAVEAKEAVTRAAAGLGATATAVAEPKLSCAAADFSRHFVSLHAANDYPFVPEPDAGRWGVAVPPGATWAVYEPLLRAALARRPDGYIV